MFNRSRLQIATTLCEIKYSKKIYKNKQPKSIAVLEKYDEGTVIEVRCKTKKSEKSKSDYYQREHKHS